MRSYMLSPMAKWVNDLEWGSTRPKSASVLLASVAKDDTIAVTAFLDRCHVVILPVGCGKNQRHIPNAKATLSPFRPQLVLGTKKGTCDESSQVPL